MLFRKRLGLLFLQTTGLDGNDSSEHVYSYALYSVQNNFIFNTHFHFSSVQRMMPQSNNFAVLLGGSPCSKDAMSHTCKRGLASLSMCAQLTRIETVHCALHFQLRPSEMQSIH